MHLRTHVAMDSAQVSRLGLFSEKNDRVVRTHIRKLYNAGYVIKPEQQIVYWRTRKNRPHIYILPNSTDTANLRNIEHLLGVTDVMVSFCTQALVEPHDYIQMKPPVTYGSESFQTAVIPDKVFSLHEAGRQANFFLEYDTGMMPIERYPLAKNSSLLKKVLQYKKVYEMGLHKPYGWETFRVLFVTSSEERIKNAVEKLGKHGMGGLFLFKTFSDDMMTGWVNTRGEKVNRL